MKKPIVPESYTSAEPGQSRHNTNVVAALKQLQGDLQFEAQLISKATVTSAAMVRISHKLGRKPQGWYEVSKKANAVVWETQEPDSRYLYLQSSADVTVSLYVF